MPILNGPVNIQTKKIKKNLQKGDFCFFKLETLPSAPEIALNFNI